MAQPAVELHGYRYSVYLRIVAMTLLEQGVPWTHVEVDPFADRIPDSYLALNPFGRVPTLVHDGFMLYETTAITRYIDEAFAGVPLQPADARDRARMNQVSDSHDEPPQLAGRNSPRSSLASAPTSSIHPTETSEPPPARPVRSWGVR